MQIEPDGGTRWLVFVMCGIAIAQITLARQYLLGIACYALLISYWLLFVVVSGGLSPLVAALIGGFLSGVAVWQGSGHSLSDDIVLLSVLLGGSLITSSYIPASLIASTTVAIVPFVLLLPLILTRERCSQFQYLTLLGIVVLAAWSITSSAILFT